LCWLIASLQFLSIGQRQVAGIDRRSDLADQLLAFEHAAHIAPANAEFGSDFIRGHARLELGNDAGFIVLSDGLAQAWLAALAAHANFLPHGFCCYLAIKEFADFSQGLRVRQSPFLDVPDILFWQTHQSTELGNVNSMLTAKTKNVGRQCSIHVLISLGEDRAISARSSLSYIAKRAFFKGLGSPAE
jgi:hypothetical protein